MVRTKEKKEPKELLIEPATFLSRALAAGVDFTFVAVISVFGSTLIYRAVSDNNAQVKEAIKTQESAVLYSHLGKESNGRYLSYTSDEYFKKTGENYLIIDKLSYFYTVFLAGDETRVAVNEKVCPDYNIPLNIDGTEILPKDYYTVEWFNENVLSLPKEGQTSSVDYFAYQMDGENIDYTKIGTVNAKYIVADGEDTKVEATTEMNNYVYDKYRDAVTLLQKQQFYKKVTKTLNDTNALISFLLRMASILIFYLILPLSLPKGKTLGKLFLRLSLVKPNNEPIKRWQVIPRCAIALLLPAFLYLAPNLIAQIIVVMGLLIVDIVLFIVLKDKRTIHDLIALTAVTEDEPKTKAAKIAKRGESDPVIPDVKEEDAPIKNPEEPEVNEEKIEENPEKTEE